METSHPLERIPPLGSTGLAGMRDWFQKLQDRGLLFHPDDDPADIVRIDSGERTFTDAEAGMIRSLLVGLFEQHGDGVYEAAWPVFAKAVGIALDREFNQEIRT